MSTGFGGMGGELRFAVRVQNEEKLKALTAELRKQENAVRGLHKAYGQVDQTAFFKQAAPHAAQIKTLTGEIEKLSRATRAMDTGRFGMGLMALGNTVDDLQYGQPLMRGHAA